MSTAIRAVIDGEEETPPRLRGCPAPRAKQCLHSRSSADPWSLLPSSAVTRNCLPFLRALLHMPPQRTRRSKLAERHLDCLKFRNDDAQMLDVLGQILELFNPLDVDGNVVAHQQLLWEYGRVIHYVDLARVALEKVGQFLSRFTADARQPDVMFESFASWHQKEFDNFWMNVHLRDVSDTGSCLSCENH